MSAIAEIIAITETITTLAPVIEECVVKTEPAVQNIQAVLTQEIHEMIKNIHSIVAEIKESIKK